MKVLLYSGGTDSWLIDKLWKPDIKIYIDVGGRYSKEEIERLPKDVKVVEFKYLGTLEEPESAYIPLRNLYFIMIASNYGDEICLGAVKGDQGNKDKTVEFMEMSENIINYCLDTKYAINKKVHVTKEFIRLSKYELVQMYMDNGGTIEEFIRNTFSCHHPVEDKECFRCKACYRKFLVGYYFDFKYTDEQKRNMINYLKENVIPYNKYSGTYFTERRGEGEYAAKAVDRLFKEYGLDWKDYK